MQPKIRFNYSENWTSHQIDLVLRNPLGNNIMTRIKKEKIINQPINNDLTEFNNIKIVNMTNIVVLFSTKANKIKIIQELNLLKNIDGFHVYDEVLNIVMNKKLFSELITLLQKYIDTDDKNNHISLISAGYAELDLVTFGFIIILLNGFRPDPLIDFGVDNIVKTNTMFNNNILNDNKAIIIFAGFESMLPSVIGTLTHKPIIAVPSSNSYGIGEKGIVSFNSLTLSPIKGITIFNIDNVIGACMFSINVVNSINNILDKLNKNIYQVNKIIKNNTLNSYKISKYDNMLLENKALRNIPHQYIYNNKITFTNITYIRGSIIIIYCNNINTHIVNNMKIKFSDLKINCTSLLIDVHHVITNNSLLTDIIKDYDIIICIAEDNGMIVTTVASICNNVLTIPIIALPLSKQTYEIIVNNCISNIATVSPNNIDSCIVFVMSLFYC